MPAAVSVGCTLLSAGCSTDVGQSSTTTAEQESPMEPTEPDHLADTETLTLTLEGQPFRVWVARTDAEQRRGLMHITASQLAPLADGTERGMLFVFPDERVRSFWMRNTIIPLDIAYLRSDGTIVKTHTMPPLVTRTFTSIEPARFALEINAGRLDALGVYEQTRIEIPEAAFKMGR
jgi:hypothetical protein